MPCDSADRPVVLAFDTSGAWCSVAVAKGVDVLATYHSDMARGQGEALFAAIDHAMADADVAWRDLSAIGVGTGPGNFTGIRIAISAARGLALGLGIPAIGVDRFEAAALGTEGHPVAVPALRDQVWLKLPGEAPILVDQPPLGAIGADRDPAYPLAVAIARLASSRIGADNPRPAPLYLRDADAAPPSEAPPALID